MEEQYNIRNFQSPLALLDTIIKNRKADLLDLPIAEISRQYLDVLQHHQEHGLDMELASEFIVMAASLMQIKTRMLLPDHRVVLADADDPRHDLVLQLMAYRRMKSLAGQLESRHEAHGYTYMREPIRAQDLGIIEEIKTQDLRREHFDKAVERMILMNQERYNQQSLRIKRLLKRDRFSVKETIKQILHSLRQRVDVFFHELFPPREAQKSERIIGFLAVLELVQKNEVWVKQEENFGSIQMGWNEGTHHE